MSTFYYKVELGTLKQMSDGALEQWSLSPAFFAEGSFVVLTFFGAFRTL